MADIDQRKLVKLVKQGKSQPEAAEALGLTTGQLSMLKYCQAQVEAGDFDEAPATPKSVLKLRDKDNHRWELIAAIIGEGVAKTKALYAEAGGDPATSYTGRGRNFSNGNGDDKKPAAKSTGRRSRRAKDEDDDDDNGVEVEETKTTRGRGRGRQQANKPAATGGRSRTRSSRSRRGSGNPS